MLIFTITEISILIAALYTIVNNIRPEVEFAANTTNNPFQIDSFIKEILPNIYFEADGGGNGGFGGFGSAGGMRQGTMYGYGAGAQDPSGGDHATNIEADRKNRELTHGKKSFFGKLRDRIYDLFESGCV